jgi:cytoplasmic iron level regulating protein YaaA (DUF328/UPF0246 family)
LAAELRRLQSKDIKKQLHVNDALAKQYEKSLGEFEKQQPVPACCLYDTPFYRSLAADNFDRDEAEWANDHIRILSGLYGVLKPFDEITPLSLPVSLATKLKNSKGNFLKDYWREHIAKEIDSGLKKLPIPVLINMAAEQDADVLGEESLPENTQVMSVDFKTPDNASARGEFIRWAMEQRCMSIEELLEFKGDIEEGDMAAYRVNSKLSKGNMITFEENTGEGGDGGWKKKMAESGLGTRAFKKEFTSGKNRYLRSDLNTAKARESKQNRKARADIY